MLGTCEEGMHESGSGQRRSEVSPLHCGLPGAWPRAQANPCVEAAPPHLSVTCQSPHREATLTVMGRARHCARALEAVNLVSSLRKHHLVCRPRSPGWDPACQQTMECLCTLMGLGSPRRSLTWCEACAGALRRPIKTPSGRLGWAGPSSSAA